jgi:hypothetical protein
VAGGVFASGHRAAATDDAVDGASKPSRDRLHAASQRVAVACLDDEVRVVAQ